MIMVYNLLTEKEFHYSESADPIECLKVSYALENKLGSRLATDREGLFQELESKVLYGKRIAAIDDLTVITNKKGRADQ